MSDHDDLPARLRRHVEALASEIGERHVWRPKALIAARDYVREQWTELGCAVQAQSYRVQGVEVENLEVEIAGGSRGEEIFIVGAHYDSVPSCPAANDNGSGVAAIIEMARMMRNSTPAATVRFVGFVNEEPPFFQGEAMGSVVYAKRCRERGEKIAGMISMETIGYYSDEPNSQQYPLPGVKLIYSSVGNFIGFVSDLSSRSFLKRFSSAFRAYSDFPVESAALPAAITGVGWSDHWSFWQEGYPAVMVTDTAPFRYEHYHRPTDTAEKLDYVRMAKVVEGVTKAVEELAG
jgi:Zn-dependent M28 family amino/carboxypeptidase